MAGSLYGVWLYGKGFYSALPAIDFVGNLALAPWFTGDVTKFANLGGTLSIHPALNGTLNNPVDLSGALAFQPVLVGSQMPLTLELAGALVPVMTMLGDVTINATLSGSFAFDVFLANPPVMAQPIWNPAPQCDDPVWQEAELCDG